jgi:hypothetical protein
MRRLPHLADPLAHHLLELGDLSDEWELGHAIGDRFDRPQLGDLAREPRSRTGLSTRA